MGTFVFRWPYPADHVYVTGDFDDWGKSVKLDKVGDIFEKEVHLDKVDSKISYKFVVDDKWTVDDAAPKEDDGHYNVNNILVPDAIKKTSATSGTAAETGLASAQNEIPSSNVGTSAPTEAPTVSAGGDGAPLIAKDQSEATASRAIPHVTPDQNQSNTRPLPQADDAAASANEPDTFKVAPIPATGHSDIQSSVTTSKEDYDKVGSGDDQQVSVNPLPATGHKDIQSSVTTSKEDYEKAGVLGVAGAAIAGVGAAVAGVFSKPKEGDKNIIPESSLPMNPEKVDTTDTGPFISSAGPGTTTADLASQVPLEPKREAQVVDGLAPSSVAAPFVSSSGPGTTTADLASKVPLEQKRRGMIVDEALSPQIAEEKAAVDKELLQKVPESQATGEPASAAATQSSYYGLATSVPETVEESIAKAHASPEAATEVSVVAEKAAVERELAAKVPVEESAGEPAPTLAAATATTAPASAAATTAAVTDGKTANEVVPETDTSTQTRGVTAGEIAGGAAVGGMAAAGAAALAAKHDDKTVEPSRVADSQKPAVTSEAAPATQVASPVAAVGETKPQPGVSPAAGAAISDGTEGPTVADEPSPSKTKAPIETSEATATEYAPPRKEGTAPGVSPSAAAALADGTEDPTLESEPAVKMMNQNENETAPVTTASEVKTAPTTDEVKDSATAATPTAPETPKKAVAGPAATGTASASATSTPAKSSTTSPATGEKKKKRNRLSQIFKKIFD